jgi:hypothetical protein
MFEKGYKISITIVGETEKEAEDLLIKTTEEIKSGTRDCSEHDDSYLPYRAWSCFDIEKEHLRNKTYFDENKNYIGMSDDPKTNKSWKDRCKDVGYIIGGI